MKTLKEQQTNAKLAGLTTFEAILPCTSCGTHERYTSTRACIQCQKNHSNFYNSRNREARQAYAKKYYSDVEHKLTEAARGWLVRLNEKAGCAYYGDPWNYLNFSLDDLKEHLQRYLDHHGWSWSEWGIKWQIDHKISVAAHISAGITDPNRVHSLSNLHVIHIDDNRRKHAKSWEQYLSENPSRASLYNYSNGAA
ncbi:hypothetical protein HOP61_13355 [Halomonas daqingensis]|uniref:HNH nuclease domain-containing protein n=1 Tax=Billgrantia desiderata TaxID=52021 RepID=A0AAW4YWA2_9GAMM|nr:hypothetical protein [Halomonas desiderata]MCE8052292.1 hypothetical protein [Halomonas desiderata]